ncbi:LOW QUALITY PROTEIN: uncharacterized protein LOC124466282 [Hypomesus transpacificus]|uniref:LOW QUALITY PROTEIN: uncharacterized protein LOC124466282 n=1 Tax=Hypomesus transpacificus TaxID=137520 RepID=UPI001F0857D3|nr:LOW QUALITY PROTEIN: uncharacterized protein LOC124466282 [Hypomesus transpacificus]
MSSSPSLLPSDTNTLSTSVLSPLHLAKVQESHVEEIVRKMKSCTCTLDPIPTALLKSHIPTRSPFITKVVNLSLQSGCVPPALKVAVIRPLLKKPTLDAEVLANYRLISILAFLSKVLEKVIASQLKDNLKHNILYEQFQSGFCSAHSTETAVLRVTNDLLMTADAGSPSLLILLDLTAAFDSVDHYTILLERLHTTIGLSGSALKWFQSYLSGRTACLGEIKAWMRNNFLQLNSNKTEALLVGTLQQVQSPFITHLTFDSQVIPLSSSH